MTYQWLYNGVSDCCNTDVPDMLADVLSTLESPTHRVQHVDSTDGVFRIILGANMNAHMFDVGVMEPASLSSTPVNSHSIWKRNSGKR
jgi:hypothetical protein